MVFKRPSNQSHSVIISLLSYGILKVEFTFAPGAVPNSGNKRCPENQVKFKTLWQSQVK